MRVISRLPAFIAPISPMSILALPMMMIAFIFLAAMLTILKGWIFPVDSPELAITNFLCVPALAIAAGVLFFASFKVFQSPWDKLAYQVIDGGDALVVRMNNRSFRTARIPLADIVNVDTRPLPKARGGASYTTLTLRTPCCFGSEVMFLPIDGGQSETFSFSLHSEPNPMLRDLIQRIEQTRTNFALAQTPTQPP